MNCTQAELWIQQSLDESLTPMERDTLDAHLAVCPACAARWREYRALARAAAQWTQQPVPVRDDFTARLMAKIEDRASAPSPSPSGSWLQAAALAGFAGTTMGVVWALRPLLPRARLISSIAASDPRTIQTMPAQISESVRDLFVSASRLPESIPSCSWILPVCLLAFAANLLLVHYTRRRTA